MANIKEWLENVEERFGEQITAIVIGAHDDPKRKEHPKQNKVLSREEGLLVLDEEFDNGYGGADCYRIIAWTDNRVFFNSGV